MKRLRSRHLRFLIPALGLPAFLACQAPATVACADGTTSKPGTDACSGHGGAKGTDSATTPKPAPAEAKTGTAAATATATSKGGAAKAPTPQKPAATSGSAAITPGPAPETALMGQRAPATAPAKAPVTKPAAPTKAPAGASARCKDGTYSMSKRIAATCSTHGGVAKWINKPAS